MLYSGSYAVSEFNCPSMYQSHSFIILTIVMLFQQTGPVKLTTAGYWMLIGHEILKTNSQRLLNDLDRKVKSYIRINKFKVDENVEQRVLLFHVIVLSEISLATSCDQTAE